MTKVSMKKIVGHTLIYVIIPQLPKIINILLLPVLTPYLTTIDYGVTGLLTSYLGTFSALKDIGLTSVLVSSFFNFKHRFKFIWSKVYGFLTIWSIGLSVIVSIILFLLIPEEAKEHSYFIVFLLCFPIAFFDTTYLIGSRFFQLSEKPLYPTIISVISSLVSIFFTFYLVKVKQLGYLGIFIAGFIGQLTSFIIYIGFNYYLKFIKINFKFNFKWLYPYLIVALPTIPHAYSQYIFDSVDRVLLKMFNIPLSEIGKYNLGYSFGQYFSIINSAIGVTIGNVYLRLYSKKNLESEINARDLTFVIQTLSLSLGFLVSIWIKEIFTFLIRSESLLNSYKITSVIIMSYASWMMYYASINKLIFFNKTKELWKIYGIGSLINVGLNLIFIPLFDIWGAVISTFLASQYVNIAGFFVKSNIERTPISYKPWHWLGFNIFIVILSYFVLEQSILIKIFITLILILTVLFNSKYIKKKMAFEF